MLRPSSRHDEQRIDPDVVASAHIAPGEPLGGHRDAAQAPAIEGKGSCVLAGARLDLDECQRSSATGDDIDLTARHSGATGKDLPTLKAQVPAGECFGASTAPFGLSAVHLVSSIARA